MGSYNGQMLYLETAFYFKILKKWIFPKKEVLYKLAGKIFSFYYKNKYLN